MENIRILFVDDEKEILHTLKRSLRKEPYSVVTTDCVDKALDILKDSKFELVISDYRMPKMNGVEFLGVVKEKHPDIARIMLSGYAEPDVIIQAINDGEVSKFIKKPWDIIELKATIASCLIK